jgi:tetratricopeptide (TPR) repeat protein
VSHLEEDNSWRDRILARLGGRGLSFEEIADAIPEEMPGRARVEALMALSFEARNRKPKDMLLLASSAQIAADNLGKEAQERDRYTAAEMADLQARAWVELANAYRVCEDMVNAERALAHAASRHMAGTGDPRLIARLLDIQASLRTDQRRLDEALRLLDRVHDLYLDTGDTHLAGRALVSKGIGIHYDGSPAEAIEVLQQGLSMLDTQRDAQLLATGQQALLDALATNGQFREARRLLLESGLRQIFAADPINLLKLRWVEARIFAGLGKPRRAEKILAEIQAGFLGANLKYEAALVSLERAEVLLQLGHAAEVETIAEEALAIFEALHVKQEALRAVRFLHEACRQKAATSDLVRQVIGFLQRLERKPYLRFALA